MSRGEIDKTFEIGSQMLQLAEQEGDIGLQVEGDLLIGPAYAFRGQPDIGLRHLDRAIANFDPQRHGRAKFRLGPNPGVAAHAIVALLRWMFGYSEQADRHAQQALELATHLQHPYSFAYATFHAGLLELWNERVERAEARAGEVLELATAHDYQVWKALGLVLQGVTAVRLGRHAEGLELCERGIQQYENLRSPPSSGRCSWPPARTRFKPRATRQWRSSCWTRPSHWQAQKIGWPLLSWSRRACSLRPWTTPRRLSGHSSKPSRWAVGSARSRSS